MVQQAAAVSVWQVRFARVINLTLGVLAIVFAVLFIVQVTSDLTPRWNRRVNLMLTLIWGVFAIDFFVRLVLAPAKLQFLKHNWIMAIAVLMPALGFFRIFAVTRAVPVAHLGGLTAGGSRGSDALRRSIGAHQTIYVCMLTVFIVLLASGGMVSIEQTRPDANINTFGKAAWWTAATLTTIGSELFPVSWEGRTLAVAVMIYGLVFSGYITAVLAAMLLGQSGASASASPPPDQTALLNEIRALRKQLEATEAPTGSAGAKNAGGSGSSATRPVAPGTDD